MIRHQDQKTVVMTFPVAIVDDASFTTIEVDTKGWDYAQIFICVGFTDIAMAALAVTEADVTATSHANVTGLIFATSNNIAGSTSALPTSDDDNKLWRCDIDLRYRKRFLDLTMTAGNGSTGTFAVAWCVLSRGRTAPITAAQAGCEEILRV